MAGRGPAPKDPDARRRRNAEPDLTVVVPDGALHGPPLPDEDFDWPDATLTWWDTWRRSAQAKTFTATDWSFLLDTAILHMAFWDGDRSVAAELRLRAAKFGATPEDRARLKIAIGEPTSSPSKPTSRPQAKRTAARKDRLLKAVGDGEV